MNLRNKCTMCVSMYLVMNNLEKYEEIITSWPNKVHYPYNNCETKNVCKLPALVPHNYRTSP